MRHFEEAQNKVMSAYAQSGQYHTIVESLVHLTWYQSHALNLAKCRTNDSKRKGVEPQLRGGVLCSGVR